MLTRITQGSNEWERRRRYVVGGSELGTVLGHNKFLSRKELLRRKASDEERSFSNEHTRWGTFFEPIAVLWLEGELGVRIEDRHSWYTNDGLGYSPDGTFTQRGTKYLLEIKCPSVRKIGGNIPVCYQWQMEQGCYLLDTSRALYAEFTFAVCPTKWSKSRLCLDVEGKASYRAHIADGVVACPRGMFGNEEEITWKLLEVSLRDFLPDRTRMEAVLPEVYQFLEELAYLRGDYSSSSSSGESSSGGTAGTTSR